LPTGVAQASAHSVWLATLLITVWAAGSVVVIARWYGRIRRLRGTLRQATPVDARVFGAPKGVRVLTASWSCEPAVVGVWRPALVLPADIESRLTIEQLESVIIHELCHIRRRDNLAAAAHMLIDVMFWFHTCLQMFERIIV